MEFIPYYIATTAEYIFYFTASKDVFLQTEIAIKYIPQCTASAAIYIYQGIAIAAKDIP